MNSYTKPYRYILYLLLLMALTQTSCIRKMDLSQEPSPGGKDDNGKENPTEDPPTYLYPFDKEVQNATTTFVIRTKEPVNMEKIQAIIPPLKYNKQRLFILTQDDCAQSTYCRTWAMINGKPISSSELYPTPSETEPDKMRDFYYRAEQLSQNDLPPTVLPAQKTLGCTDGAGNEVRFSFSATLAPESALMSERVDILPGFTKHYSRFYRGKMLIWSDARELLNYGCGIAFHDVEAEDLKSPASIIRHFEIAQDIIRKKLSGRGCKMLAEPNGNKTYIEAAKSYAPIQTVAAQTQAVDLYPFQVTNDLHKVLLSRILSDNMDYVKQQISLALESPISDPKERKAIHIGAHNTSDSWIDLFLWLNNTYGKDGDDSVWMPSQEEYYEYNYYRIHGSVEVKQIDDYSVKLTVSLPSGQYFYYPSVTVNVAGLQLEDIASVESNETVTGLSYANYGEGLMLNIDCRKYLAEHAEHFVERYEKNRSDASAKADATYFVSMLKESAQKDALNKRIK